MKNTLYGTTVDGGTSNAGTVFSITTTGTEKVLYSFAGGSDGAIPGAGLIDVNGTLYGTTYMGGRKNYGTVFSVTTTGKEKVLYSFSGSPDGAYPRASLIDVNGTLYGTTFGGGGGCSSYGCGTVFSVTTGGDEKVLYAFAGGSRDGANPDASLINVNGTLYGTTGYGGGASVYGTVFSATTKGRETVLYRFSGGSDGAFPDAGLINVKGTLYGTTAGGGVAGCQIGCGTVFTITTRGKKKTLYRFGGSPDGGYPAASLIDVSGTLYGTTAYGGGSKCRSGCGTVFSVTTSGTETVLHRFRGGSDGSKPFAGLLDIAGTLYGTAEDRYPKCHSGADCGTVFALAP